MCWPLLTTSQPHIYASSFQPPKPQRLSNLNPQPNPSVIQRPTATYFIGFHHLQLQFPYAPSLIAQTQKQQQQKTINWKLTNREKLQYTSLFSIATTNNETKKKQQKQNEKKT